MSIRILHGDCRDVLKTLPDASVQCCVTSPPYFGLRDYGVDGQIGLEPSPDEYVAELVAVFREVRRVLRDDGVLFLNLGDSYYANGTGKKSLNGGKALGESNAAGYTGYRARDQMPGLKPKDLIGIPWMVAFALRADGWWLRRDIIWAKPNPMPESVTDRPTSAHEYVFLLTKSARYYWNAEAVRESPSAALIQQINEGYAGTDTKDFASAGAQSASGTKSRIIANARAKIDKQRGHGRRHAGFNDRWDAMTKDEQMSIGANCRSVWTIATSPLPEAHFATFPPALSERCILAGSRPGDTVIDPFGGAGTTGLVADRLGRGAVLIELNPDYIEITKRRVTKDAGLFADITP